MTPPANTPPKPRRPVRLCYLCRQRPAAVPDRERMGRQIKTVCRECHAGRLCGDLRQILAMRNRAPTTQPGEPT